MPFLHSLSDLRQVRGCDLFQNSPLCPPGAPSSSYWEVSAFLREWELEKRVLVGGEYSRGVYTTDTSSVSDTAVILVRGLEG